MFCRFILIAALCDQISIGWTSANQAIGKIRTYSIIFYTLKLLVVLIAWWCLQEGLPIISVMWGYVAIEFIGSFVRLPLMKYIANIPITPFFKNVFLRIIGPLATMVVVCYSSAILIDIPYRLVLTFSCSLVVGVLSIWGFALNIEEKQYVKNIIKKLKK